MAGKIETLVRTVRGLTDDARFASLEDPHGLLPFSEIKLKAYRENPCLGDLDQPCQLIGVKDNKVIGRRNSFPGRFVADGKVYHNRISGSVYVDPKCRASMYALRLLQQALKLPDGELNINCWMSEQNQKFYRLFGSGMVRFEVFEAGGRWSRYMKRVDSPKWKAVVAKFVNVVAAFLCRFFDNRRWRNLPDWNVREIDVADSVSLAAFCDLVGKDHHRYRQEITPEWIRWTVENDFLGNCRKSVYRVYDGKDFVGFALVRQGYAEKFIKIYEWQLAEAYADKEAELLSVVAKSVQRYGSRVQIAVGADEESTVTKLKARFPVTHGNYAAITIADGSRFNDFAGIKDPKNWRVRPGMGDACLW